MAVRVEVKFSSSGAAGAVLAWTESNIAKILEERREARRTHDYLYIKNLTTELAGQIALRRALQDAGVQHFLGHERS